MLERICDFLRATLRLPESPLVPIATEIGLARQYLEVMQSRLEDRMQFAICCHPGTEGSQLPALLLQPLVENAVEHGQDPVSGLLNIAIDVQRNDRRLQITIRDRGPGPANGRQGKGLTNTKRRLQTVYGDRAALQLSRHPQGGAVVEILIPA
jgi:sensor histidine kinase YesM